MVGKEDGRASAMNSQLPSDGVALFSTATPEGTIRVTLEPQQIAPLADDELLVRIEATPINPSDLGLLFGPADIATVRSENGAMVLDVPERLRRALAARLGTPMPVGNEGAGTVVAAGASAAAQALIGRVVASFGGAMYRRYRVVKLADAMVMPEGTSARDAASLTVNPLTALAMVGTMRRDGHSAIVHTAAASNLGQMLSRLCAVEGIPLVNIVRSAAQAELLRGQGAAIVLDSTAPDFFDRLIDALAQTGATVAFDAIGGGRLGSTILTAMEAAQARKGGAFSVYGSTVHKQLYIYGGLDPAATELTRSFGFAWGVSGWLLTPYLMRAGADEAAAMRERVIAHRSDIFASRYTAEIPLTAMLDPAVAKAYQAKATGTKYLVNPGL
jgi:NADPH:quinone reductase-like Zn-dependent oxidoreductase